MIVSLTDIPSGTEKILVRCDLNVPMTEGNISDTMRISHARKTIRYLKDRGHTVIVISHFAHGSLESLAPLCAEIWGCPVFFQKDYFTPPKNGQVNLLENLRFFPGEKENDLGFSKMLASIGQVFVNEAFSVCHRAHASVDSITRLIPSYAGFGLQKEISSLSPLLNHPASPFALLIGGAKISTKLPLLKNLIQKVDCMLIGGAMSHTFLAARGIEIGNSLWEKDLIEEARELDETGKCILPSDVVLANREIVPIEAIMPSDRIFDIGPETIKAFKDKLAIAKTIVWNGPMGWFETQPFDYGTHTLVEFLGSLNETVIAGGGETASILKGKESSISFLSTGGGAFLSYLQGETLPGIQALIRK